MNFIRNLPSFCFLELKTIVTFTRPFNSYVFQHSSTKRCSLKSNICSNQQLKRNLFTWFTRQNPSTLKKQDKIPEEYKLVYKTTFDKYLIGCQWLTTTLVAILGFNILNDKSFVDIPLYDKFESKPRTAKNEIYVYMASFIGFIVILHLMMARIPARIYNHAATRRYIFVFYGNLPLSKKHLTCTINEVIKVDEYGIVPWRDCRYKIIKKGHSENDVLLFDYYFRKPSDLNIMLGYEKDHIDEGK